MSSYSFGRRRIIDGLLLAGNFRSSSFLSAPSTTIILQSHYQACKYSVGYMPGYEQLRRRAAPNMSNIWGVGELTAVSYQNSKPSEQNGRGEKVVIFELLEMVFIDLLIK